MNVKAGTLRINTGGTDTGLYDVDAGATLQFNGGTRNINTGADVTGAGALLRSAGTTNFNGTTSVSSLNMINGHLSGTGTVTVLGAMTWTGSGQMGGSGTTVIDMGATLTLSGTSVKYLENTRTLTNLGTASQSGGAINTDHVFGLIPDPYAERVPDDVHEYFESVQPDVLSAILIALGSDAASSRGTEISKNIAERQTRLVLKNKSRQKLTTELGLRAATVIGLHLAEGRLGIMLFSMVPVMGGGVNALFCYMSMQRIGRNLITDFEHEHRKVRPDVLSFWQNGGGERDKPLSLPSQIQITRPAEPIDT